MTTTNVKPGDRIRATHTVEGVVDYISSLGTIYLTNRAAVIPGTAHWTTDVELLKHPKGEPGDVITGQRLRDTWWKRGTVIYSPDDDSAFMLHADGRWYSGGANRYNGKPDSIGFQSFEDDEELELLVVPQ